MASLTSHTTTYIEDTHLQIHHDSICHVCSALYLLRIFISDSTNQEEIPGQQQETQGQNSPGISVPPPSPPPPTPRDFEALRANRHRPISPQSVRQPLRQPLSPRLPDPPVFTGTNSISFDDWKMRIRDKLTHNGDHFPTDAFKIAYVVARLGGEASQHVSTRRRYRSYSTVDDLLDHLSNVYEVPLSVLKSTFEHAYDKISQGSQPFLKFYGDLIKYAEHNFKNDSLRNDSLINDIRKKSELRLCDSINLLARDWTVSELKERIMRMQLQYQQSAEEFAEKKAQRFAEQYAKAKAEADAKKGKYSIMTRPTFNTEGLSLAEAEDLADENWAYAQKHGKYFEPGMDFDEAYELSCQGFL
ncbi:hypothetical protein HO173_002848 [Letharia columbiana]|uniref:Uncharacterized protein n=1 Tax=Letharia columbiana TaxID=112416 RepID=A0A8H6G1T6_9LECA|nr:uncharacterized protein HO173_002848 [Letharia columbiana]KAF6238976.1 hypothetical protein HO173_002848 [Letharia columbiana]